MDPLQEFYSHPGRKWLSQLLMDPEEIREKPISPDSVQLHGAGNGPKFVDTFRLFHPQQEGAFTCWSTVTGARATNYGTRIDYIISDVELARDAFCDCVLLQDIEGSDHCPVKGSLDWEVLPAKKCPELCTKYFQEFAGKQQKLSAFFAKSKKGSEYSVDVKTCPKCGHVLVQGMCMVCEKGNTLVKSVSETTSKPVSPKVDKVGLKRSASQSMNCGSGKSKKARLNEKQSSSGKQGNLLAFFGKKPVQMSESKTDPTLGTDSGLMTNSPVKAKTLTENTVTCDLVEQTTRTDNNTANNVDSMISRSDSVKSDTTNSSSSWKSLLKGPPPPPPCKGHGEPCVLRTVKKDSLNKGRQFWVCCRPEGHKSNPEARCEHFEWIVKKKNQQR